MSDRSKDDPPEDQSLDEGVLDKFVDESISESKEERAASLYERDKQKASKGTEAMNKLLEEQKKASIYEGAEEEEEGFGVDLAPWEIPLPSNIANPLDLCTADILTVNPPVQPQPPPQIPVDSVPPVEKSVVTGITSENPKRRTKDTHDVPTDEKISIAAKVSAINKKSLVETKNYENYSSEVAIGRRTDGTYTIIPDFLDQERAVDKLKPEDMIRMHQMWFRDAWASLRDPPEQLKLEHFLLAIPTSTSFLESHSKTVAAQFNLRWAKFKGENATPMDLKDLADFYRDKGSILSVNDQILPEILGNFSKDMSSSMNQMVHLISLTAALQKELALESKRCLNIQEGGERGSETKLDQIKEAAKILLKKEDDESGSVMKQTPSVLDLASETISVLSGASGHRRSSLKPVEENNDEDVEFI